jgi:hypothetical protein
VRYAILNIIGIAVLIVFITACDENPVTVGEGILPEEDFLTIDTVVISAYESFSFDFLITTSGSEKLFVGENQDHRTSSILRFTEFLHTRGITPDTVNNSEVFSATLFLHPVYYIGDSIQTIPLYLYEVLSGWSTQDLTRDVFDSIERSTEPIASASFMLGDTNAVGLPLPADLISRWAEQGLQSILSKGLIIGSDETANGIVGFQGAPPDNQPQLRIIYGTEEQQDTITIVQNARAYSAYNKRNFDLRDNIVIQSGAVTRAVVRFDLSQIPQGSLIHNAQLELTRNPDLSYFHPEVRDSLFAHHLADPNKLILRQTNAGRFTTITDTLALTTIYRASVSEIVQAWATVETNNGFIIRDHHETLGLHRASFYTETAQDVGKRPRLTIIYSRM